MQKIPTIFERDWTGDKTLVTDVPTPGCEWVFAGQGTATRKYDGTCCMVRDGKLYKRYDCKKGKTPPPNFEPAMEADPVTGHLCGWLPVGDGPEDRWHREAFGVYRLEGDTYELCGPKIQGNPERLDQHVLVSHQCAEHFDDCPRTFDGLKEWLADKDIEGIVFHHPDGRMAKIKKRDLGLSRKPVAVGVA